MRSRAAPFEPSFWNGGASSPATNLDRFAATYEPRVQSLERPLPEAPDPSEQGRAEGR